MEMLDDCPKHFKSLDRKLSSALHGIVTGEFARKVNLEETRYLRITSKLLKELFLPSRPLLLTANQMNYPSQNLHFRKWLNLKNKGKPNSFYCLTLTQFPRETSTFCNSSTISWQPFHSFLVSTYKRELRKQHATRHPDSFCDSIYTLGYILHHPCFDKKLRFGAPKLPWYIDQKNP